MRRLALLAVLLLTASACATRRPPTAPPRPSVPSPAGISALRVEVGPRGSGQVRRVAIDAYLRDVVVAEIAVAAADVAIALPVYEAQAIIARTYAARAIGRHAAEGFDLCSTTHCQVYREGMASRSRWAAVVEQAVARTRGMLLLYDGRPIEAVFHAHCGGHTSAAVDVWGGTAAPYLAGTADPFCMRERPARWTWRLALTDLLRALNSGPRTAVGARLDGIQVVRRDAGGRAAEVLLSGTRGPIVTGEQFRLAVLAANGAASLRSTHFDVRRVGGDVIFEGVGSGHGVGLCQTGLIGRIRAGQSPRQALEAYYRGARIANR